MGGLREGAGVLDGRAGHPRGRKCLHVHVADVQFEVFQGQVIVLLSIFALKLIWFS